MSYKVGYFHSRQRDTGTRRRGKRWINLGNSKWAIGLPAGEEPPASGDVDLIPGFGRSLGEGNGNLLQYSCPENSVDRGEWQAMVYGVAKSQTWLTKQQMQQQQMVRKCAIYEVLSGGAIGLVFPQSDFSIISPGILTYRSKRIDMLRIFRAL